MRMPGCSVFIAPRVDFGPRKVYLIFGEHILTGDRMVKLAADGTIPGTPSLEIPEDALVPLYQALKEIVETKVGADKVAGELEATKKHLVDFQRLVFERRVR